MATAAQLADIYVTMLNTHEPDLVDRFVAEGYINHNPFVEDGREANRQFWTGFFAGLPDLSATMEDLVISGDRVVGRFVYRGTHTGEFQGMPATGRTIHYVSHEFYRVQDGLIAEEWICSDMASLFRQLS